MSMNSGKSEQSQRHTARPSKSSSEDHEKKQKSNDVSLSSIFALDIGINEYKSANVTNLEGAVADADDVKNYLLEKLGVPQSNIRSLRDEQATRKRIIQELCAFQGDSRIQYGDPILIYYAGHGGTSIAPPDWPVGNPKSEIQLIVPHDYTDKDDKGDTTVYGIPDHTIGRCIAQLARAKGNNITVIFDCCHSASGTRNMKSDSDEADEVGRVRAVDSYMTIPPDLDYPLFPRGLPDRASYSFTNEGIRSHILLAACGVSEKAREIRKRGVFTKALLEILKSGSVDMSNVTYEDIIRGLPTMKGQNPQCEGYHKDRIIFRLQAEDKHTPLHPVRKSGTGNKYQMDVGSIYGITEGAQFEMYQDRNTLMPVIGILVAKKISPRFTVLDVHHDNGISERGFARQITPGDRKSLLIHIPSDPKLDDLFNKVLKKIGESKDINRPHISRADIDQAPLRVSVEGDQVVFHVKHDLRSGSISYRLSETARMDANIVCPIVWGASFYFHHLLRSNSSRTNLLSKIKVEFLELELDEDGFDNLKPRSSSPNLNINGVVEIDGQDIPYGIKIDNTSLIDLYVYIFFFDSNLSIEPYYSPGISNKRPDVSLVKQGSLTLGYGPAGTHPLTFTREPEDERKTDVGYIKMFFSTQSVELPQMKQSSPFLQGDERGLTVYDPGKYGYWDTLLLPIIHRCPSGID